MKVKILGFGYSMQIEKKLTEAKITSKITPLGDKKFKVEIELTATVTTSWQGKWDGKLDVKDVIDVNEVTDFGVGGSLEDLGSFGSELFDERTYIICCK